MEPLQPAVLGLRPTDGASPGQAGTLVLFASWGPQFSISGSWAGHQTGLAWPLLGQTLVRGGKTSPPVPDRSSGNICHGEGQHIGQMPSQGAAGSDFASSGCCYPTEMDSRDRHGFLTTIRRKDGAKTDSPAHTCLRREQHPVPYLI